MFLIKNLIFVSKSRRINKMFWFILAIVGTLMLHVYELHKMYQRSHKNEATQGKIDKDWKSGS